MRRCGWCMLTQPVGGRGAGRRLRALSILDKLSRRTPVTQDMAMGFGRHLHVHPEPTVVEHGLTRRCGWCMPTRPVGGRGAGRRLRALMILDKLSCRTPATRDMAMGFGRHLHVNPEPTVVEHGLTRRCGWFMPTRPVGGRGAGRRLRALMILDKLSRRTPATQDMAMGFGRHLHVNPEPTVVEHGLTRRCGWFMPTWPVGGRPAGGCGPRPSFAISCRAVECGRM